MDEIEELAKELDVKIPGHSYYDYVTKDNYPDSTQGIYSENGLLEHFSPYMTSKSIFMVCLTAYVAVDDRELGFPVAGHFVYCDDGVIDERKYLLMKEAISLEDGPYNLK